LITIVLHERLAVNHNQFTGKSIISDLDYSVKLFYYFFNVY